MSSNKEACRFETTKAAASELLKTKSRQEQEEKLILAAWQNMQDSLSQDSAATDAPQSFLAKQRQFSQTRRVRSSQLESRMKPCSRLCEEQNEGQL